MLKQGIAYMSSEESGSEEDDISLQRKPLTWLKQKSHNYLWQLDDPRYKLLKPKSKTMYRKRIDGVLSTCCPPENCPAY